jgi:GDPmannose 4,6-dehydratase
VGIKIKWEGSGINEKGINVDTGDVLVEVDEKYFRPTEVELLLGDPTKAQTELGWKHTYSFSELVKEMVNADMELFKKDEYLKAGGHKTLNQHE